MITKNDATSATASYFTNEGLHNVYFVFKNSKAGAKQPLMQMVEIQFQNTIPPPTAKK